MDSNTCNRRFADWEIHPDRGGGLPLLRLHFTDGSSFDAGRFLFTLTTVSDFHLFFCELMSEIPSSRDSGDTEYSFDEKKGYMLEYTGGKEDVFSHVARVELLWHKHLSLDLQCSSLASTLTLSFQNQGDPEAPPGDPGEFLVLSISMDDQLLMEAPLLHPRYIEKPGERIFHREASINPVRVDQFPPALPLDEFDKRCDLILGQIDAKSSLSLLLYDGSTIVGGYAYDSGFLQTWLFPPKAKPLLSERRLPDVKVLYRYQFLSGDSLPEVFNEELDGWPEAIAVYLSIRDAAGFEVFVKILPSLGSRLRGLQIEESPSLNPGDCLSRYTQAWSGEMELIQLTGVTASSLVLSSPPATERLLFVDAPHLTGVSGELQEPLLAVEVLNCPCWQKGGDEANPQGSVPILSILDFYAPRGTRIFQKGGEFLGCTRLRNKVSVHLPLGKNLLFLEDTEGHEIQLHQVESRLDQRGIEFCLVESASLPGEIMALNINEGLYQQFLKETHSGDNPAEILENPDKRANDFTWFQAVTFCNWLSQKAGRSPVYYCSEEEPSSGVFDAVMKPGADGWRMLTKKEWLNIPNRGGVPDHEWCWDWFCDRFRILQSGDIQPLSSPWDDKKDGRDTKHHPEEEKESSFDRRGKSVQGGLRLIRNSATAPEGESDPGRGEIAFRFWEDAAVEGAGLSRAFFCAGTTAFLSPQKGEDLLLRFPGGSSAKIPCQRLRAHGLIDVYRDYGEKIPTHEIPIPAGLISRSEDAKPRRMHAFSMMTVPVTVKLYKEYCADTHQSYDQVFWETSFENHPVTRVSWYETLEFANWLSRKQGLQPAYRLKQKTDNRYKCIQWIRKASGWRLPSLDEWFYAAHCGVERILYFYAGSNDINQVAWYRDNSGLQTHPVAKKAPNEWGLHDMTGNVSEWCWDVLDKKPSHRRMATAGGSFFDSPENCWISKPLGLEPSQKTLDVGFRLIR